MITDYTREVFIKPNVSPPEIFLDKWKESEAYKTWTDHPDRKPDEDTLQCIGRIGELEMLAGGPDTIYFGSHFPQWLFRITFTSEIGDAFDQSVRLESWERRGFGEGVAVEFTFAFQSYGGGTKQELLEHLMSKME